MAVTGAPCSDTCFFVVQSQTIQPSYPGGAVLSEPSAELSGTTSSPSCPARVHRSCASLAAAGERGVHTRSRSRPRAALRAIRL